MATKIITKSFERLLVKGRHRGFITYEELGKSLGKRNGTIENIEKAFIIIVDEKITLVEKKSQYQYRHRCPSFKSISIPISTSSKSPTSIPKSMSAQHPLATDIDIKHSVNIDTDIDIK